MGLNELETATKRKVQHVLFIDDCFTWRKCGRSYLCRMIDTLPMGDEIIFGRELPTRLPVIRFRADATLRTPESALPAMA
jgi:hypothetical protein